MNRLSLTNLLRVFCMIIAFFISHVSFAEHTHMGVEPSELISLTYVCPESDKDVPDYCVFKRTFMYGPTESDMFHIPSGKVLVVTEFDWKYTNGIAFELDDQLLEFRLNRALLCSDDPTCPRAPVKSYAVANQFGPIIGGILFASGTVQMTTGFAISSPAILFPSVRDMSGKVLPVDDFGHLDVTVRGYLVTASCGLPGQPPCR